MTRLRVRTTIDAPPRQVWRAIADVGRHGEWMDDVVAIRFTSSSTSGTGTTFDCDTKVGPFHLTDRMEITEWSPPRSMGVRHVGIVTGAGRFKLRRARHGRTRFTWDERLRFPLRLGGPIAGVAGRVVLGRVWRRNLANLKELVEEGIRPGRSQPAPNPQRRRSPRRRRAR